MLFNRKCPYCQYFGTPRNSMVCLRCLQKLPELSEEEKKVQKFEDNFLPTLLKFCAVCFVFLIVIIVAAAIFGSTLK